MKVYAVKVFVKDSLLLYCKAYVVSTEEKNKVKNIGPATNIGEEICFSTFI